MRLRRLLLAILVTLLLVPAFLVTGARVVQPRGGTGVRLVSFTPFALVLYAAALLVLLPVWRWGRGAWRGVARALCLVAVLGIALHAMWASGPYVGAPRASAEGGPTLRVMTSNLRVGEADTAQVMDVALANHVDVLVLEEITPTALDGLEEAGLRDAFPRSAGKALPGTHGTMVFSTYPLRGVSRLATGFESCRMTVRAPGGPIRLLAVHPRPPIGDAQDWWTDHRVVRGAARALDGPAMLVGDFNATMDHAPMRELVGRGYTDAATAAKAQWQPTWPASGEVSELGVGVPPLLPIDHVLVRERPVALHTDTFSIDGTDHRALVAVLRR